MQLPQMATVRQRFDAPRVDDIASTVRAQIETLRLNDHVRPGDSLAITAGSRGIANIGEIIAATVDAVRTVGLEPFIVPAMGSHGGGTAEGQVEVLASLGITEELVKAPIRSSMETIVVTETRSGVPVHFDRLASEADHVLIVNRIKPHTRFVGPIESGLHKMMLIGLGKHTGASIYHRAILAHSFSEILADVAEVVLEKCGVIGGLAIVENALDETALIEAVPPNAFAEREAELLKQASDWLPSLPVAECDLLIIDQIGKNISGSGMDTNVVGRKFLDHMATPDDRVSCRRILVRSLTKKTNGNASGIGIAEFTTQSCVDLVDPVKTSINCITALHPEGAMIPITLPNDREAVEAALKTIGLTEPENAKVIQISDTLHLDVIRASEACLAEIRSCDSRKVEDDLAPIPFDSDGNMASLGSSGH
ncbi:MAG: nickel-dependent lactate racemase [Fuerstiella sp.]|nr:nickel-dependent lactate racemase [Fuerstiella sp.]